MTYLALLAYKIAKQGFSLIASVNKSTAFWSSPEKEHQWSFHHYATVTPNWPNTPYMVLFPSYVLNGTLSKENQFFILLKNKLWSEFWNHEERVSFQSYVCMFDFICNHIGSHLFIMQLSTASRQTTGDINNTQGTTIVVDVLLRCCNTSPKLQPHGEDCT